MASPNLEAGFFFLLIALGFLFTFVSFRAVGSASYGLRGLAMSCFLILAIVIGSGFQVSMTTTSLQTIKNPSTGDLWTENDTNANIILTGGKTTNWFAWVFDGLAIFNLVLLLREMSNNGVIKGFRS